MYDHLVIDELILFGKYDASVRTQKTPELFRLKYVNTLIIGLFPEKLFFYLYRHFHMLRVVI